MKRREGARGAREGVQEANLGGFVEHDEPAVGGAADSGAVRGLRVEEMGFVEGEVEEGAAR